MVCLAFEYSTSLLIELAFLDQLGLRFVVGCSNEYNWQWKRFIAGALIPGLQPLVFET